MSINSRNGNTLLESGFFAPCRAATTGANIALSGLAAIDGVTPIEGDRILVKDQTDATTNGIYAAASGNWVRTSDAAGNAQFFDGMAVNVAQGATNAGLTYLCTCTDDPVVIGSSLLTFASQQAVQQALQQATSTTSAALTTGAKTFATQSGKSFAAKQWVLIYQTSNPDNCLLAEITSYSGTSLVVSVAATGGSGGPFTNWTIVLTNTPAAAGRQPPTGSGNVTGPGSSTSHNLPRFADTTGKVLEDSGLAAGTLAGRNSLLYGDAAAGSIPRAALAANAAPVAYVAAQPTDNLTLSNDGTNPNTDIQITAGRAPDDTGTAWLQLAATMLKRIDTAWAAGGLVGTRKGMLLSGSSWLASKTYHLWLIGAMSLSVTAWSRTSNVATVTITGQPLGVGGTIRVMGTGTSGVDGVAAITAVAANTVSFANTGADVASTVVTAAADGFDIGATQQDAQNYPAATLPSGFTLKQCLGSIMTDGSKNVLGFVHFGDIFELTTAATSLSNQLNPTGNLTVTLNVPLGVSVFAKIGLQLKLVTGTQLPEIRITAIDSTAETASQFNADIQVGAAQDSGTNTCQTKAACVVSVRTSTSGTVRSNGANVDGNTSLNVTTLGWRDLRRRMF